MVVKRISGIAMAGLILWLLWGERVFWPAQRELPAGTVLLSAGEDLAPLASGRAIAIQGTVFPATDGPGENLWKERFAYRRAVFQKDDFGSLQEVVTHLVRPAVRFHWAGADVTLPADSYRLESAPAAPDAALLQTTEKNVGFRRGDAALALGRKTGDALFVVDELAISPIEAYLKSLNRENTLRTWIGHSLRVVVSLFALSVLGRAFTRQDHGLKAPPSNEGFRP